MSTVPYTFANNYGNIPLSELDDNFASCKAFADTAGVVTEAVQPAITSVGTLTSLTISGNTIANNLSISNNVTIGGNLTITGNTITVNTEIVNVTESVLGNIIGGNILTGGQVSAVGNITGGNLYVTNIGVGGDIYGYGNILTGSNVSAAGTVIGNIAIVNQVSATGNVRGGNIYTGGLVSVTGNIIGNNISSTNTLSRALDVETVYYANITANAQTINLSVTSSINILIANNTGYTTTVNMPSVQQDGQICNFAIHGNTVTLVKGVGNVLPTFAGSTTVGTGYRYVYRVSTGSWYKIG